MTAKHIHQKKQRCPRCGDWLTPDSVLDWEKKWKLSAFSELAFPKDISQDSYSCKGCGYTTSVLGSTNRNIQEVLRDLIRDNLTNDERLSYVKKANDPETLAELYQSLSARLQLKGEINGLAALIIGLMPQDMRENVIMETTGMPVDQILAHIETRVMAMNPDHNLGDLAVALTL